MPVEKQKNNGNFEVIEDIKRNGFSVGQTFKRRITITEEALRKFADATGDFNPIHLNEDFAKKTRFGQRIAQGMLVGAGFSAIFGTELPGAIYRKQELSFNAPIYIGDTITATATVTEYRPEKHVLILETTVTKETSEQAISGTAVVLVAGVRDTLISKASAQNEATVNKQPVLDDIFVNWIRLAAMPYEPFIEWHLLLLGIKRH